MFEREVAMKKFPLVLSILSFLVLLLPTPALADGIIIPEPPICDPELDSGYFFELAVSVGKAALVLKPL